MIDYLKEEKFFSALASSARLKILDCIFRGIANPGEIAEELDRHRSSIEKHIRILTEAGIIEKMPSLNQKGQLSIRYRITLDFPKLQSYIDDILSSTEQ